MSVQFGVHIGPQNATISELRQLWRWLDRAGVDWISTWDHLYEAPPAGGTQPHFEAVATLAAIAADTERARVGSLVFCALYRNVGLLAKAAVTIDHLSGGRFELGIGSGWHEEEARAFGFSFPGRAERHKVLDAQVRALRSLFAGQRTSQEGLNLVDANCLPRPAGRLPIWIGGTGRKKTLRLAGALADGWNAPYVGAGTFRELNGVLDDWCAAAGRSPSDVERSVNLMYNLGADDPATVRANLEKQWGELAEVVRQGSLIGRPGDVMEQVAPYVEAGAQLVNVVIRPPWEREVLDAYVTEVVPAMRREWPATT
jgi:alkanesulfonate monooxygenase SsuD/methylene tetrahydromethanopterin reductase-like flavin-dependent oxidoreductase (luciferase family)